MESNKERLGNLGKPHGALRKHEALESVRKAWNPLQSVSDLRKGLHIVRKS